MAGAIIGGAIGGLGSIMGGKAQADAAKEAARLQSQSAREALDFTKGQYGDLQTRLKPYIESGQTANQTMAALLARSPYAQAVRGQVPALQGPLVTLRAPDGSTKQVPQAQAQQFIARGAQQVA